MEGVILEQEGAVRKWEQEGVSLVSRSLLD